VSQHGAEHKGEVTAVSDQAFVERARLCKWVVTQSTYLPEFVSDRTNLQLLLPVSWKCQTVSLSPKDVNHKPLNYATQRCDITGEAFEHFGFCLWVRQASVATIVFKRI
jgi:hypothetical protein